MYIRIRLCFDVFFQEGSSVTEVQGNGTKDVLSVFKNGLSMTCDFTGKQCTNVNPPPLTVIAGHDNEGSLVTVMSRNIGNFASAVYRNTPKENYL